MYHSFFMYTKTVCALFLFVMVNCFSLTCSVAIEPLEDVSFTTLDGKIIHGAFFPAGKKRVVVFTHGAVFSKESWYPLAERLQEEGIASLPFDFSGLRSGHIYLDIPAVVNYLKQRGFDRVELVGASMGAVAILRALSENDMPTVDKVILLAPGEGQGINSTHIDKLFIVAQGDWAYQSVVRIFNESVTPKRKQIIAGSAHAQHLFKTLHRAEVENLIIDFLKY